VLPHRHRAGRRHLVHGAGSTSAPDVRTALDRAILRDRRADRGGSPASVYLASFGLKAAEVALWTGLTLMAPAVTQALTGPFWGWVGDRCGRKAMVVRAQLGVAVTVGLMAITDSPEQFLVFRLVQGAFGEW
jgi:MFS family permease